MTLEEDRILFFSWHSDNFWTGFDITLQTDWGCFDVVYNISKGYFVLVYRHCITLYKQVHNSSLFCFNERFDDTNTWRSTIIDIQIMI